MLAKLETTTTTTTFLSTRFKNNSFFIKYLSILLIEGKIIKYIMSALCILFYIRLVNFRTIRREREYWNSSLSIRISLFCIRYKSRPSE